MIGTPGSEKARHDRTPAAAGRRSAWRQPTANTALINVHLLHPARSIQHGLLVLVTDPFRSSSSWLRSQFGEAAGVRRHHHFLDGVDQRAGALAGEADVKIFVQPEVKHHVKPVIIAKIVAILRHLNVDFAEQYGLRIMSFNQPTQMFQEPQPAFLLAASGLFRQMREAASRRKPETPASAKR
jgi:hypothetical protein